VNVDVSSPRVGASRALGVVSGVQLATGLAGLAVALRRRRPYDLPVLHGRADTIGRDSIAMGTALSAPAPMLVAQAFATAALLRGGGRTAERVTAVLGAAMVVGYLGESLVRRRLRPSGFDPVETSIVALGIGTAAAMAVLAAPSLRRR